MHTVGPTPLPSRGHIILGKRKNMGCEPRQEILKSVFRDTRTYDAAILYAGGMGGGGGAACTSYESDVNYTEVVQCSVHPPSWSSLALGPTYWLAGIFAELTV